jgi:hypothetical protein
MKAHAIAGTIEVLAVHNLSHMSELEVNCPDYATFRALPAALLYGDKMYGRKGWNSDNGRAYFGTDKNFAMTA